MGLTAQEIVQMPVMDRSMVKTGGHLLESTKVEWISVIEGPVENFVRKNEFVLSTGIGCEDQPDRLEQFVLDVIKSGASLLGIATGRYVFTIPDRVISIASRHQFIILELPWEVRFGDVLQSVLQQINQEKQEQRQMAEGVRQQLISCVLQDGGLSAITKLVHRQIAMPIAVLDSTMNTLTGQDFDKRIADAFNEPAPDDSNQSHTAGGLEIVNEHPLYHYMDFGAFNGCHCYRLSIQNNNKIQGYVVFQPKSGQKVTWFVMNVLEHAHTAYALQFAKENAVEMAEIRLKDTYVRDLAKNDQIIEGSAQSAQLLGYDLSLPYTCFVGKLAYKETFQFTNDSPANSSLQSLNFNLQKEITNAGSLLQRRTMATFEKGEAIIYLEDDQQLYYKAANQFLDMIERRLYELVPNLDVAWGIAKHGDGIKTFQKSYQEARTALEIGLKQHVENGRTFFEDTKINRLLMAVSRDKAITDMVSQTLSPLLEYDKKRKTDLIQTFLAYNQYKGNVSQTARALNLHRQSLLHRLRNIESLTQLSLVDSDDLFLLELSVRLWMMQTID
ncbi:PucR family transcriptional regulator [Sediminibacillus albus]|uniref:Purine catabolism regulatory protein n=1 Tax=Sediminibacillus albus TaxID=407036 RepID=A0A1G8ZYR3_9BACI|nr:PucR family transcriptional regulator [Sediminibacillus albus]SDK20266.1 purine catabolism regulatory protein [Sediminibacillus albus]